MIKELSANYEEDVDSDIELAGIRDMHYELIHDSIEEQVKDPFVTQVNFMEEYFESIDEQRKVNGENPEIAEALRADGFEFCKEVIHLIDEKYGLGVNNVAVDDLGDEGIKSFSMALYEFFVTNYPKNVKKFFIKYIISHSDDIADVLSEFKNKTDVVTTSLKEKLDDDKQALILSNLKKVIEYVDSLELGGNDILTVYNQDRWDVYTIINAMQDMLIGDTFGHNFFYPLLAEFNDSNYEIVFNGISSGLLAKFMKKK